PSGAENRAGAALPLLLFLLVGVGAQGERVLVGVLPLAADEDVLGPVLAVLVEVEANRLRVRADREVDAVNALVGLEVEGDRVPLGPHPPVPPQRPFLLQVVRGGFDEGAALDRDGPAEMVLLLARGRAQVPALFAVPDRVAGALPRLELF